MDSTVDLERHLDQAPEGFARLEALNKLAWVLRKSDMQRSLSLAEQAQTLCESQLLADGIPGTSTEMRRAELVRSLRTQAHIQSILGDYREAMAGANRGLELSADLDMPRIEIDLLNSLAWCLGNNGDHAQAIKLLLRAKVLAEGIGNQKRLARVLNSMGAIYGLGQDYPRAVAALLAALEVERALAQTSEEAITLNNLAQTYSDMGRSHDAYNTALQSLALADEIQDDNFMDAVLDTLGVVCLKIGQYDEALAYLDRSVRKATRKESKSVLCTALLHLGQVYHAQGRHAEALAEVEESLRLAVQIDLRYEHYQAHETLAGILEAMDRPSEALGHCRLYHAVKEEVFNQAANERLHNLQTAYELDSARKDAEIHQLRNVALEQEIAERRRAEKELEKVIEQLQTALDEVHTLSGLVPICASCKKIRADEGYWQHVEEYISSHTDAKFSHGICPECAVRLYGEFGREAVLHEDESG